MAASFVAVRGTGGGTGFASSFTITGVTCAAGNDVVVLADSSQAITSISDGTNTYTIDKAFPGTNKKGCIAHYHYSGGFSGTITVNLAGASVDYNGEAWECSGFNGANTSADVRDSANNSTGFGGTVDAGTTVSSAQIGDLIVAGFVTNAGAAQTLTAGSGYTAVATVRASTNSELLGEYQVAASVAVAHPTGSISSAAPADAACVIYVAGGGAAAAASLVAADRRVARNTLLRR